MRTWIYYQRRECPICNGARKDCRKNGTTNFIHCRDESANPIDYIFRGLDALGFGMWAYQPDVEAWKDEPRKEWQREKELERELKLKQEQIAIKEPFLKQSAHQSFNVSQLCESIALCSSLAGDSFNWGNGTDNESCYEVTL